MNLNKVDVNLNQALCWIMLGMGPNFRLKCNIIGKHYGEVRKAWEWIAGIEYLEVDQMGSPQKWWSKFILATKFSTTDTEEVTMSCGPPESDETMIIFRPEINGHLIARITSYLKE